MNSLLLETVLASGQTIQLVQGNITAETTDAIVNAANAHLQHGAGVAGAILRQGGPVGHAAPAWTTGGSLPCRIVIHAVGPVWGDGDEDEKLAVAITGSLRLADELGLGSIAIPAISTGIFGFPKERAAAMIFASIREYLANPSGLHLVRLVLYDTATITAFEKAWHDHFDPKP